MRILLRLAGALAVAVILLTLPSPDTLTLTQLQPGNPMDDFQFLERGERSPPPPPPPPPVLLPAPQPLPLRTLAVAAATISPSSTSNSSLTSALASSPLEALVTDKALRGTFGDANPDGCGPSAGKCRLKIIGGSLYRTAGCKGGRRPNIQLLSALVISALARAAALGRSPVRDVTLCIFQGANPTALDRDPGSGPILQWCTFSDQTLSMPSPYEADCVYKHRYVFTLEHHRRLVAAAPRAPLPWEARRSVAVWRGTCTGAASLYASGNLHRVPRAHLAELSQDHPELLDAVLFPCARCSSLLRRRPLLFGNVSQALSDYSGFKYVVDLDGDGCSGRLSKLLDSGSVVLKPWAPPPAGGGFPFFYRALKPWTHFVPIEPDLSNIVERVEYLRAHDSEARAIASAATAFAKRWLSPQAIDGYTLALLDGMARLQRGELKAGRSAHLARRPHVAEGVSADDEPIYAAGQPGTFRALNRTDHKERPLNVDCPVSAAEAWMLRVSSAAELAQSYLEAAGGGRPVHPRVGAAMGNAGRKAAARAMKRGFKLVHGTWRKP